MTKQELSELLHSLNIAVNEGIQNDKNVNTYPRVVYWDYVIDYVRSSGTGDYDLITYQISFFSKMPRDSKLLELRKTLKEKYNLFPTIYIEYIENKQEFHSYFSLEVLENV